MNSLVSIANSTSHNSMYHKLLQCTGLALTLSFNTHAGVIVDISSAIAGTSQDYKNTTNHIIGKQDGYFGANIFTDDAESTDITVEFLGSQAKWNVDFTLSNGESSWTINNHPNNASGVVKANNTNRQQGTINVGANQLLDFSFDIDVLWNGIGSDYVVDNGSNTLPTSLLPTNSGRYFWTGFEHDENGAISAIILGLDDGGGWPTTDEDNDDLMIRMSGFNNAILRPSSLPEVPLPASMGLFASAIGVLAVLRRKKTA
jgi:hypothetical protein